MKRLASVLQKALARNDRDYVVIGGRSRANLIGCYWDFTAKRPQGFRMQSERGGLVGQEIEPFTWYDVEWSLGSHIDPGALLGRPVNLTDPESFDPETDGLELVNAQRRSGVVDLMPDLAPGLCRIGGHVDMTEVTRAGVKVWHLHTYPDRVGSRIDPHAIGAPFNPAT